MSADDRVPPDFWVGVVLGALVPMSLAIAWWAAHRIEALRALLSF